ncbi:MAG: tetratricopeptide repeat protein [Cyanothece sp. SIO1E1]|nr:tetratricopeptide repeat protein [Cyanothece sp. SIO1E1]
MGLSLEVNSNNFTAEVIEKSYQKPVLVDFFAQWCGPCQVLKPLLEKLVKEYDFVLAKVDIDQNPDLANAYGVSGVPDVKVFTQGEVQDGFVGVLPEPDLRHLLGQLQLQSELEVGLNAIQAARSDGDVEAVKSRFNQLIETYPQEPKLMIAAARFLIEQGKFESAEKLIGTISADSKEFFPQAQALKGLIQFQQVCDRPVIENELDRLFVQASRSALIENYEAALQSFLEIVHKDRKYRDDGARKAMLTLFSLLGNEHPLTAQYRKQLMLTLY